MTDNETFLNDELRLAEDSAADWNRRAVKAEAKLKIAMEALEFYAQAGIMAKEAIAKINALETEGK